MARLTKDGAIDEFKKEYILCSETRKSTLSRLINKLLNEPFIYSFKEDDRNDYHLILEYKMMIEDYLSIIDYELVQDDIYKIFFIRTTADRNRIKFKKLETVILLLLRLLYYKSSLKISLSTNISTTLGALHTEVNKTGIYKERLNQGEYINALKTLKKYKIIDFSFTDLKDDNLIIIYPTILHVVKLDDIEMIQNKLNSYISNRSDENEATED